MAARGIRRGFMSGLPTLVRDFAPILSAAFLRHPAARGLDTLEHAQLLEVLGDLRVLLHQALPVDRMAVRDRRGHRDQDRILVMLLHGCPSWIGPGGPSHVPPAPGPP